MNKKTLSHVSTNRAPLLWTMSIYANYILVVSLMMRVSEARTASSDSQRISPTSYGSNCEAGCIVFCPPDPKWELLGDRCYYWSKDKKTWFEAENECRRKGGHLASVTNQDVHSYLQSKGKKGNWIGGKSEYLNETWVWTDCSTWGFDGWKHGRQPNEFTPDCVAYLSIGKGWYYWNCQTEENFVCSTAVCSGI